MGKKGSQLKAFKDSLRAVTKPSGGKRKGKSSGTKDADRSEKLKHIEEQFNAFDTKFTRLKHDVFGRKVKGKVGKPGTNKEASEQIVRFRRYRSNI
jgi:nucleolar protein 14